ncbi:MAG: hypothetical protein A4S09_12615 [Proteobacteria bacterium SG_bin7]|nr:MAG: hypothetical protein A4S09_12615 [Proteobacteria bacterium SG_bin7]
MKCLGNLISIFCFLGLSGCALFSSDETVADLDKIAEFDKKIQISEIGEPKKDQEVKTIPMAKEEKKGTKREKPKPAKKSKASAPIKKDEKPTVHFPEFEDSEGFIGRRPVNDPYRIGEKVVLAVKYFGVVAGDLTLEVGKMVEVNGRKSYTFITDVKSNSSFAIFYKVDDNIKTFVDYDNLVPMGYSLRIRETNDTKEGRGVFDWSAMKAFNWKKYIDDGKVKEEKDEHPLEPFSQNVYSAIFYLRNFKLAVGKQIVFRVNDAGKTLLFKGQVLRKETLETALGPKETFVIKPQFELDGIFKPVGDIYMWITDDDRKYLVRVESKIKIGKIVGDLKAIEPGEDLPASP